MQAIPAKHPLRKHFRLATRQAIALTGKPVGHGVRDYLSESILARFVHVDNLYIIRDARGRPLVEVAELLLEAHADPRAGYERSVELHQHVGDYALFMAGLFPQSLARFRPIDESKDVILMEVGWIVVPFETAQDYYVEYGRRGYQQAAKLWEPLDRKQADLFAVLSETFRENVALLGLIGSLLQARQDWQEARQIIAE